MSLGRKFTAAVLTAMASSIVLPPVADASPDNQCGLAVLPICSMIPAFPDLDHDVDLTTDPNGLGTPPPIGSASAPPGGVTPPR